VDEATLLESVLRAIRARQRVALHVDRDVREEIKGVAMLT
jgi:hypothetical protein